MLQHRPTAADGCQRLRATARIGRRAVARHCQRVRAVLILLRRFILRAIACNRRTAADIRQRPRAPRAPPPRAAMAARG